MLAGLKAMLSSVPGEFLYLGSAASLTSATEAIRELNPGIIFIGEVDPPRAIVGSISHLLQASPQSRIIIYSENGKEPDYIRAIQLGARAVVQKHQPVEQVLQCLRTVAQGNLFIDSGMGDVQAPLRLHSRFRITPREKEIIELVCRGLKNREIAESLSITPGTVKVHLMHIFEKTGLKDRYELALRGKELLERSPAA
ncbi:MAG TPA: response regulator transcription factor [Bryobacteraceae bacterium]|jgi:DNA-binding NarL/FixJ family response regulator|nr:response regulator transcription factor [Bryobacteraceae bacterium]